MLFGSVKTEQEAPLTKTDGRALIEPKLIPRMVSNEPPAVGQLVATPLRGVQPISDEIVGALFGKDIKSCGLPVTQTPPEHT